MESKDLSIVIVTFKSEDIISKCLKSIPNDIKVIIVENSKNEKFKKDLENKYKNVDCILTGSNRGYAAANNIGLNIVKTKYALVLNPDCILEHETIRNFFITANKVQDFHLIGPAQDQMINMDFKNNDFIEVENLKGFAIFFNMSKFSNKFFDENYFLYFEEIDLCKYVKKNNGKIYLDKNIVIKHEGGSSVKKLKKIELEKNRNWHWMWSTFYFYKKNFGYFFALKKTIGKLIRAFLKFLFYTIILNNKMKSKYKCRFFGLLNSMMNKKSWYRVNSSYQ